MAVMVWILLFMHAKARFGKGKRCSLDKCGGSVLMFVVWCEKRGGEERLAKAMQKNAIHSFLGRFEFLQVQR